MMKFEIKDTNYGYYLRDNSDDKLIALGGGAGIGLFKNNRKNVCYCCQHDNRFDYHGIKNALSGVSGISNAFPIKQFVVIQMN